MLTERQKARIMHAFNKVVKDGAKVVFVVRNRACADEFAQFIYESTSDNLDVRFRKLGSTIEIRLKEGHGTLCIEAHLCRDQYRGRTFSKVFIDECADIDQASFDILASRVRPA